MTKQILHYEIHPVKVTSRVTEYRGYIYDESNNLVCTTELYLSPDGCEHVTQAMINRIENKMEVKQ